MICYLVRHGVAEERSPRCEDGERALTVEGVQKMRRVVSGLHRLRIRPDAIWSSPLRRAHETADLLAAGLEVKSASICAALAPGSEEADVLGMLQTGPDSLMLVGHQPDLGRLASYLLTGDPIAAELPFKKGGVACLAWQGHEVAVRAQLQWFLTPGQLRLMGRA